VTALPFAFLSPWLLLALAALPALYWLLKMVPPRPREVDFPPLPLLLQIKRPEETPARTPWWLIALRLLLAAFIIFALARPVLNPLPALTGGNGPLVLVVDDDWAAAPDWKARVAAIDSTLDSAESAGRSVALVPLSAPVGDIAVGTAQAARDTLQALNPAPTIPDRSAHLPALRQLLAKAKDADLIWYSDGLNLGDARSFAGKLAALTPNRPLTVFRAAHTTRALAGTDNSPSALTVRVLRAEGPAGEAGLVRAFDLRGRPLGDATYAFKGSGAGEAQARFELPTELRNDVARLELANGRSAGGVQLLDDRWKRRAIGLISGTGADSAQPLVSPVFYIERALEPFADVREAGGAAPDAVESFTAAGVPVIALADVGRLTPPAQEALKAWLDKGGVLIRFAGTRLAAASDDPFVPVPLRRGGRVLGGSLAWSTPQKLGAFPAESPFAGLAIPDDVVVRRQVLAEPQPDLARHTWAVLADGTPLVTSRREGKGLIVLFHVTADTVWSNLPISGLFVEMLRRTVALSGQAQGKAGQAGTEASAEAALLPPTRTLDGFGAFRAPPASAHAIRADAAQAASAQHPPGIYGPPDGFVAVNTLAPDAQLASLDLSGVPADLRSFAHAEPTALAPALLAAAMAALLLDTLIMLWLSGAVGRWRQGRRATAAALVGACALGLSVLSPPPAHAQDHVDNMEAALTTRLAYVVTGNAQLDEESRAGLQGLSDQLAMRTAFEPGPPVGVDPARDELAFYPLLYWPVSDSAETPSSAALAKIDAYMKNGGTILFDTRDALYAGTGKLPGSQALQRLIGQLDIPELEPVPPNHVLTRSFYLLGGFPGRYADSPLWVEATPTPEEQDAGVAQTRTGDGVSPILITANDMAGAWATDANGNPLFPTEPGSERQREMAYRAGINIVMYALTGNYKADQVHVPALLERLGQ